MDPGPTLSRTPGFSFAWSNLLGYDIFISYRRSEASEYAERLHRDLRAAGLTVFLDRDETPGGSELTPSLARALRRSRMLVLLLTPDVLQSAWVQEEVRIFSGLRGRAIVPINFESYIQGRDLGGTALARMPDYSWIDEAIGALRAGAPSEAVVREIAKGYSKVRVRTLSRAITAAAMLVLALTSAVAVWQMREAQRQAEISLAGQLGAQAELLRIQDPNQLPLATALAAESMARVRDLQAERTLRAALGTLPVLTARFAIDAADHVALSADGKGVLAMKVGEPHVKRYDLSGTKLPPALVCSEWTVCDPGLRGPWTAVARSERDGGAVIHVMEVATGHTKATVRWERLPAQLLVDGGGRLLFAIDAAETACLWSLENGQVRGCFEGPGGASWHFNANGTLLAAELEAESDDEDALDSWQIWNTDSASAVDLNGDHEGTGIGASPLSMSATGRYVVPMRKGLQIQLHDLENDRTLPPFRHEEVVRDALFSETDLFVVTRTDGYNIRVWILDADAPDAAAITTAVDRSLRVDRLTGDGLGVVTEDSHSDTPCISIWRLTQTTRLPTLVERMRACHSTEVYSFDMDRAGERLVTLDEKGVVRLWDCRDGNLVSLERYQSDAEWEKTPDVASAAPAAADPYQVVSPAGTHFAVRTQSSVDRDPGAVVLHDASSRRELARIRHAARVNDARFSADGRFLATGGSDHAIRIWDVQAGRQVSEIRAETSVQKVRFTEGDRYIRALGDDDGMGRTPIYVFRWKPEDLLEAVAARQVRVLSGDQWSSYLGSRRPVFTPRATAY